MRAAVYEEPQRLNVEGIPVPEVGPQDLLVRVGSCGICGSDVHSYKAGMYIRPGRSWVTSSWEWPRRSVAR